jgi:hypothetical protein
MFLLPVSFYEKVERKIFFENFLASERIQVDEFFLQSSLTQKPVVK